MSSIIRVHNRSDNDDNDFNLRNSKLEIYDEKIDDDSKVNIESKMKDIKEVLENKEDLNKEGTKQLEELEEEPFNQSYSVKVPDVDT